MAQYYEKDFNNLEGSEEYLQAHSENDNCNTSSTADIDSSNSLLLRNCVYVSPSTSSNSDFKKPSSQEATSSSKSDQCEVGGSKSTLECPICLQTCVHPARLPCGHIFCFLCVKGVAYKNRRCAMCRRDIPPEFLDQPQLVNGVADICLTKTTEDGYQWFYEGRNGWWQYDDRTSQDIEDAFKKGEKSCTILVAGYVYIVDLEAMLQQRQNEPTRCRRVKRDLATTPKKGVAGLRIEGNKITDSNFGSHIQQNVTSQPLSVSNDVEVSLDYEIYLNDFMTTIANTDAAIHLASNFVDSLLVEPEILSHNVTTVLSPNSSLIIPQYTNGLHSADSIPPRHELLESSEDMLNISPNVPFGGQDQSIGIFEQTVNNLNSLTLRSVIEPSDEEDDETEERYTYGRIRL